MLCANLRSKGLSRSNVSDDRSALTCSLICLAVMYNHLQYAFVREIIHIELRVSKLKTIRASSSASRPWVSLTETSVSFESSAKSGKRLVSDIRISATSAEISLRRSQIFRSLPRLRLFSSFAISALKVLSTAKLSSERSCCLRTS